MKGAMGDERHVRPERRERHVRREKQMQAREKDERGTR